MMKKRPLAMFCVLVIFIQLFFLSSGMEDKDSISDRKERVSVVGCVYRKEIRQNHQILYLRDAEVSAYNKKSVQWNMIVYDQTFQNVCLGNRIFVTGEGGTFDVSRNPGNYDQRMSYAIQGIRMRVFAEKIHIVTPHVWRLRETLFQVRQRWHHLLLRVLGEKKGGMLSAMLTGEKEKLDREIREQYQVNGIGHLLAISGLHLSFIGVAGYQGLRKLGLSYLTAGAVGGGILTLYGMMTGMSVSTTRALLMFLLRIGADMSGRVYDRLTALLVSAVVILLPAPRYMYDAGFLLSYGAIAAICLLLPVLQKLGGQKYRSLPGMWKKVVDGLYASIAIQLFLFPVTLYFFFEIPLYGVLLNVLVIPLMSVVLGAGLLGSLFYGVVPFIGETLLKGTGVIFSVYDILCENTGKLPLSRIVLGKPKWQQVAACYLLLVIFCIYMGKKMQKEEEYPEKWRKKESLVVLGVILAVAIPWRFPGGKVEITMLDVGQGDGLFIRGPSGGNYMIDGGSSDVKEVGRYRLESFLKAKGVGALDYVLISHGDGDHMNGIQELLGRQQVGIRIRNLVLPVRQVWDEALQKLAVTAQEQGTHVWTIRELQSLREKELSFTCLQPAADSGLESGNEASMVLQMRYKKFSMLFTGDVEGKGEEVLVTKYNLKEMDVLKVAHHGSRHSTGEELLKKLKPKIGLISSGVGNSYGHPHRETRERLEAYGVKQYLTQTSGAVTILTDGSTMEIKEYLP